MKNKKVLPLILILAMVLSIVPANSASAKVKLSATSKTLYVGKSTTIKISGAKSVKWSVTNSNIRITKKTKSYAKVKAMRAGTSYLKAKIGNKIYKCKFIVRKAESKVVSKAENKVLCEDENISLIFKEIKNGKIILVIKNKSKKDFTYGNRYVILNGKTYYDDFLIHDIYSETEKEDTLVIYTDDLDRVDYIFNGGTFSGRIYYRFEDSDEEIDLSFSITI